jgi:hypothetical protein
VSTKTSDAKKIPAEWWDHAVRDEVIAWLKPARLVLERRFAALHATAVVRIGADRSMRALLLGEARRDDHAYNQRPLTVASLFELRSALEDAYARWREMAVAISSVTSARLAAAGEPHAP